MGDWYIELLRENMNERTEDDEEFNEKVIAEIEKKRETEGFKCKKCGRCCSMTGHVELCLADAKKWKEQGREDLLTDEMLLEWDDFCASGRFRRKIDGACPFLKKAKNKGEYRCELQDIKPLFCRRFPTNKEYAKENFECPGYD